MRTISPKVGPPPLFVPPAGGGPPALPPLQATTSTGSVTGGGTAARPSMAPVDLTRDGSDAAAAAAKAAKAAAASASAPGAQQQPAAAAAAAAPPAGLSSKERADRKATILGVTRTVIKAALDAGRINRRQYKKVAKAVVDVAMQRERASDSKLSDGKLEIIASTYVEKEATAAALNQDGDGGGGGGGDGGGARSEKRASSHHHRQGSDEPIKRIKIDKELAISKVANWL